MGTQTFGQWDQLIHNLPDQQKRIASARKSATSPESIDRESFTGTFPSSGKKPYQTTMNSCTCVDFSKRHLPCKHMYRLAMECGQFDGVFSPGENKNIAEKQQMSLAEAVSEIEKLTEKQQKIIYSMLRAISFNGFECVEVEQTSETLSLLSCTLIKHIGTVDMLTILQRMRKRDIVALLEKHKCQYNIKLKKSDLEIWCITNAPEIEKDIPVVDLFSFADNFKKAQKKTYSYLKRKFDWDYYCKGDMSEYRYPHGSEEWESGIYQFPEDEITTLLTKYGCNRCLNGFAEEKVIKK